MRNCLTLTKLCLIAICFISGIYYFHEWISYGRGNFWDFQAYEIAVSRFINGDDPYRESAFLFVYHPYVLYTLTALNKLIPIRVEFFILYIAITIYAGKQIYEFLKFYSEKNGDSLPNFLLILLITLCFGNAGSLAVLSGNVSGFIHLWLFSLLLHYQRKADKFLPWLFALSVLVSALIKPYFMAYFLLGGTFWNRKEWALFFVTGLFITSSVWLSALWFAPDLYRDFQLALNSQVLNRGIADLGYSFFGIAKPLVGDIKVALLLHGICMILLSYILLIWLPENIEQGKRPHLKLLLLIPVVIFSNPRMMGYDFPIAILAWLMFLYLAGEKNYARAALFGVLLAFFPIKYYIERKLHVSNSSGPIFENTYWQIIAFLLMLAFYAAKKARLHKPVRDRLLQRDDLRLSANLRKNR